VQDAVPLAARVAEQVSLGGRPHGVGEVHRERLGGEPPQVRRGIEVCVGATLERFARQPEAVTCGARIACPFVRRGVVARRQARASRWSARWSRLPHAYIASTRRRCTGSLVSSASRRTETGSSGGRLHGVCLFGPRVRLPDDPMDGSIVCARSDEENRMLVLAAMTRRARTHLAAISRRAPSRPPVVSLASRTHPDRVRGAADEPDDPRAGGGLRDPEVDGASYRAHHHAAPRVVRARRHPARSTRRWVVDGTRIPTRDHHA
jgi:hypothetical protein